MAVKYNLDEKLGILKDFLKEYNDWFAATINATTFSGSAAIPPTAFMEWLNALSFENIDLDNQMPFHANELKLHHNALLVNAGDLPKPLTTDVFEAFSEHFNDFILSMQGYVQRVVLEQAGQDSLTGLKNRVVMLPEIEVEMERFVRDGPPFCIGLARIDDYESMREHLNETEFKDIINAAAEIIQKTLRSYDEAYRITKNHFIMCLKQSDLYAGQKGLERLRGILEDEARTYKINGQVRPLSISSCLAVPIPEEDIGGLIDDLFDDLEHEIKDYGAVMQHQEMSPLERFVKHGKE